jgi:uncharacterized coiled-coil DUF342 family protein
MSIMPTPEKMRARFAELGQQRDDILARSTPLREARDAFANEAREKEQAMNDKIRKAETKLLEIDQERALIARALGGKTGAAAEA